MIRVQNLHKSYNAVKAVAGVSFHVEEGEIYGLLGPNGAGKTTLISMISGLLKPDDGRVAISGVEMAASPRKARALMGVVPQETAFYSDLTARENTALFGSLYGLSGKELEVAVTGILEKVGLDPSDRRKSEIFSGGMKRRLNLAMGLVHSPRVVLMDEPTTGIDPQARLNILDVIRGVVEEGATVLYTTHYMDEAEELCSRIGIIDHGSILAEGTLAELTQLVGEGEVVTVKGDFGPDKVRELFAGSDGVTVVEGGEELVLLSLAAGRSPASVLEQLIGSGHTVEDLKIRSASLESVFIKLTGRELRD